VPLGRGSSFTYPKKTDKQPNQAWECNGDGKICPDGSVVGRSGPKCEFAACPSPDAKSATITTSLGQKMTALNVSITPKEIIQDSRCPEGVQCIWAGTVEAKTVHETQVGHGETIYKLGEPVIVGEFTVTLTNVTPAPKAGEEILSHRVSIHV